jgi:hypothetical protein
MDAIIRRISGYLRFAREEFSSYPASPAARIEALLRCKHSHALRVMEPEVRRSRTYVPSTLYARRSEAYSWRTGVFFGSKLTQKFWLDRYFPDHAPPILYYVGVDELVPVEAGAGQRPLADLPSLVRERGPLFLKPSDNGRGRGATHLALCRGVIEINGKPIADDALVEMARAEWQGYLVSEIIPNSPWSGKFYGRTLNTIRILTGVRRDTRLPVILSAIFKIGCDASFPTDNWHSGFGGITAKVDLESGRLGTALRFVPGKGGGRRPLKAHPESHVTIEGDVVPDWPAVKDLMLEIVRRQPSLGLVGWDVALTPTGVVIVEGNGKPGIDIHEAHESLLARADQRDCWAGMNIFPRGARRSAIRT